MRSSAASRRPRGGRATRGCCATPVARGESSSTSETTPRRPSTADPEESVVDAARRKPPAEFDLVVVHGLAQRSAPRHDDGDQPRAEAREQGADSGVRDDRPGGPHAVDELVERQGLDAVGPVRADEGRAVLDHELLPLRESVDRAQEAVERSRARSDGDEDHGSANTLPTYRPRRTWAASSGHWT